MLREIFEAVFAYYERIVFSNEFLKQIFAIDSTLGYTDNEM